MKNAITMRVAFLLALCYNLALAKHHKRRVPIIDLHGADRLVANIREDENVLATVPDLSIVAETGPVCKYLLTSSDKDVPFDVQVIDQYNGAAVIRVKDASTLDCKKNEYNLQVVAVRCEDDSIRSEPVMLKVSVKDTNNHSPEFDSPWYTFTVNEGKIYDEIATIKASDRDCGNPYGQICDFEIANTLNDFPFSINNQGVLRNTKPLNYSVAKSYILTVVAIDCGMRRSKSALITVNVKETCVQGHIGFSDRLTYLAGSGPQLILPSVETHVCAQESSCDVLNIHSTVKLSVGHVTNGCFRDTIYNNETIQSCGLSSKTVSLMPSKMDSSLSEENDVMFDGVTNAVIVSPDVVPGLIPDKFSLSFSMKHAGGTKDDQKNKKSIICESDEKDMNRHHFSVYVRHCKLEVVLRREAGSKTEFRAAEWRWSTPQICDDEWHSYSLLFNGVDDVNLMIDGTAFKADERNPEILDDWPLHRTKTVKTRLVVGACWHGRQETMAQHFKGSLSSVYLLSGETESPAAIECAHRCPEQLQYTGIDEIANEQSVTFSAEHSVITLKATTEKEISKMLRRISYVNTQEDADPWTSTVDSVNHSRLPRWQAANPSTSERLHVDQHAVKVGTPMISDIQITVSQVGKNGEVKDVTSSHVLDYCKVHLKPSRDMDLEYFSSPASLIAALQIDFEHDKEGILLRGEESVKGYRDVLSKIHYFNTRPDSYSKRIYTVQCAMLKGRVLSNELVITMSIEPSTDTPVTPSKHTRNGFASTKALLSHHGYDAGQGAIAGGAVAVVVVVCVGFLLVLLVVGVLKMKDTPLPRKRRNKQQDDGMSWDDSGMNITVNPLDDVEKNEVEEEFSEDDESSDGDESDGSFREEELSDGEIAPEVLPHMDNQRGGLEWDDDAVMTTSAYQYPLLSRLIN
ncbi:hypothetical protein KIN20_008082 [Parelaphostrongylus tenuis]|uniref:Cadherin domain-containing protein n=1 Tax=Parelaphostrongylus tenuis TaxID=148309 RepID=A0AAD5M7F5_PARTN|nr:hypothetical protein KIN20_008082 [Parelaphostrongylus tenuis]